jgi:hypothetical protein
MPFWLLEIAKSNVPNLYFSLSNFVQKLSDLFSSFIFWCVDSECEPCPAGFYFVSDLGARHYQLSDPKKQNITVFVYILTIEFFSVCVVHQEHTQKLPLLRTVRDAAFPQFSLLMQQTAFQRVSYQSLPMQPISIQLLFIIISLFTNHGIHILSLFRFRKEKLLKHNV